MLNESGLIFATRIFSAMFEQPRSAVRLMITLLGQTPERLHEDADELSGRILNIHVQVLSRGSRLNLPFFANVIHCTGANLP